MQQLRKIIISIGLFVLICTIIFHSYTAITDVSTNELRSAVNGYSSKCKISFNNTINIASKYAAQKTRPLANDYLQKQTSLIKIQEGMAWNSTDLFQASMLGIQQFLGYHHEARIEQAGIKEMVTVLNASQGSCNL